MTNIRSKALLYGLVSFLSTFLPFTLLAQGSKCPKIPESLKNVFWSLCVQDVATGTRVVDVNAHYMMTPASTLKVFTTATALERLSPDSRMSTKVYLAGELRDGILWGNLVIVGGGDPTIGSRYVKEEDRLLFFDQVVRSLKAKGVMTIKGDIIGVSPLWYDYQAVNPHWLYYDIGNHYAAGAYALSGFDNSYEIEFSDFGRSFSTSHAIEDVKLSPSYRYSSARKSDSLYLARPLGGDSTVHITGVYPAGVKSLKIRGDLPNPPLHFVRYVTRSLVQGGLVVEGRSRVVSEYEVGTLPLLYEYLSPSVSDLSRRTNLHSVNLYAEALLKYTWAGVFDTSQKIDFVPSALCQAVHYWASRGLSPDEILPFDGSGLSPENKVTANYLTSLLGKVYRGERKGLLMHHLPVVGREGTVASFLKNTRLEGRAYLKSGSIKGVLAYTGYVKAPSGKVFAVTIMANNFTVKHQVIRKAFEEILLEVFSPIFKDGTEKGQKKMSNL